MKFKLQVKVEDVATGKVHGHLIATSGEKLNIELVSPQAAEELAAAATSLAASMRATEEAIRPPCSRCGQKVSGCQCR